ncbi:MAG: phage tail tube protein [Bryobacteraceae bacterium]
MATGASQSQIGFVQIEAVYGTIPNSSGTATVANSDAFRIISLKTKGDTGEIQRPSKTTNLSRTVGVLGKKNGSWSATVELAGSGAAGTVPDIDAFLHAALGKAGTVVTGVSVTYAPEDASPSLAIYNFRDPATLEQLVALGCVVEQMKLNIGQEQSTIEFSGSCRFVSPSEGFSSLDATAKGGLTAFPTRPSAPTYAGTMALGMYGSATLDGSAYTTVRSLAITVDFARSLSDDVLFNGAYPGSPQQSIRSATVEFELTDDDSAAGESMKAKCRAKTPMDLVFVIGATAGNIWTITLNDVQVTSPDYEDGQSSWGVKYIGTAHATDESSKDEITIVCT